MERGTSKRVRPTKLVMRLGELGWLSISLAAALIRISQSRTEAAAMSRCYWATELVLSPLARALQSPAKEFSRVTLTETKRSTWQCRIYRALACSWATGTERSSLRLRRMSHQLRRMSHPLGQFISAISPETEKPVCSWPALRCFPEMVMARLGLLFRCPPVVSLEQETRSWVISMETKSRTSPSVIRHILILGLRFAW